MTRPYRLSIITSHPIQYQAPLFRALAARPEIDLTVYFCDDIGLRAYDDPGFGARFSWDVPLLDGYRHHFLRNWGRLTHLPKPWGTINPSAIALFRDERPDAVAVNGWSAPTFWLAYAAGVASGVPLMIRGESTGLSEPAGIKGKVKRALLGTLFPAVHGFLAIGSLNRDFYRAYGVPRERIFLAPYTVNNASFQEHAARLLPNRAQLRRDAGIDPDATVFLFCGKLSHVKRPLDLLEAFSRLPDLSRSCLIYAGDGVLRPALERRIAELGLGKVRITGFQNQTELPRWYALSDVLVLPSGYEPWGLVTNEAMNFGLPVVATDRVGAAPDLVLNGKTGFVYPVGDVDRLVDLLTGLARDEGLLRDLSVGARRRIDEWGIEQTVDGYLEALRSACGAGTSVAGVDACVRPPEWGTAL